MNRPIRIWAVAGSLREGWYTTLAAKMALDLSKNYDAVTNFLDLRHTKLPIYDPDDSTQSTTIGHRRCYRDISVTGHSYDMHCW
jgi:NAD(P)H-dependent FMN reductase